MSQCWREGDWRAYIDGELPAEAMIEGRAHLLECTDCAGLHAEVAVRASRIGDLMMELDRTPAVARRAARSGANWKWAAAAVALAAALAAAFVLSPRRVEAPSVAKVVPAVKPAAPVEPVAPIEVAAPTPERQDVRPVHAARVPRRRVPQPQYFLAFDDDPIDTGTVMRVTLQSGIEADVIVDSGGRPRAIRTVQAIRY